MSTSSSKSKPQPPPAHLHLHVGTTSAAAAATTTIGPAASPGSSSSSHHSYRAASPAAPTAAGGIGSGQTNSACAACKYQRRKCSRNCDLAPYFPADQPQRFVNAQRLFGLSKITKTLKRVGSKYAGDAMRAMTYQAEARAADPVGGCVRVIEELQRQIHNTQAELELVRQQIAICRQQQASATNGGLSDPAAAAMLLPASFPGVAGGQKDGMIAAMDGIYTCQQPSIAAGDLPNDPWSHQQQLYDYFCNNNNGTAAGDKATSDDDEGMQQSGFDDVIVDSIVKDGSPEVALGEQLGQHCQIQELPFVGAFNVQPQVLPATVQHHGPAAAGDELRPQQKKVTTPVLTNHEDDVDEHMEEQQATAGAAPCHLKLGFSSFSNA